MSRGRARDPQLQLYNLLHEVLVTCPRCARAARVTCAAPWFHAEPRLVCAACGLARVGWPTKARVLRLGGPVDPWLGLPVFLQTSVRGELLWAWNRRHLEVLAEWIGAPLRERGRRKKTLVAALPTWMKRAEQREPVMRALAELGAREA